MNLTILVVDDAEDCAATLDLALQSLNGARVVLVRTAEAALEALQRGGVAAVVTDINLPAMSGIELIQYVREQQQYKTTPIVVVSANPDPGMPRQALDAGANAYFTKPFSPSVLRRRIEELLEESIHAN